MVTVLIILAAAVFSYAVGSISFAVIFSKAFSKKDVRDYGSGSAGMTNVMRAVGVLPGILTFVCDALKGFVACAMAKWVLFPQVYESTGIWWLNPVYGAFFCGLACMIGHVFPVFFGFKGGKGVATSVGIFSVCCPPAIIAGLAVFAVSVILIRIVSLSSLIATLMVMLGVFLWHVPEFPMLPQFLIALAMGILVFLKHKDNIIRLVHGEEKRLVVRKGK